MERRYIKIVLAVVMAIVMGGCVYDFEPDSDQLQGLDKPLVVIEGDIIAGGTTVVKVGFSQTVFEGIEDEDFYDFSGVTAWVENQNGDIWSGTVLWNYIEINTENLPMNGKYRLCVSIPGRGEYRSAFKEVYQSPQIDSITFSISKDRQAVQFEVSTHNNASDPLYCKWSFEENWESNAPLIPYLRAEKNLVDNTIVLKDLTETERIRRSVCYSKGVSKDIYIASTEKLSKNVIYKERLNSVAATDRRLSSLYALTVTQTALDKEAYKYWEGIKASVSGTGGLFAPMPNEIRGNIVCNTNPQENVLGYVNVTTQTTIRRFVYWQEHAIYSHLCSDETYPSDQWLDLYTSGVVPVRYGETEKGVVNKNEVYWASATCADCRLYSNATRPDFWPEGR